MQNMIDAAFSMWMWPTHLTQTLVASQRVIASRVPGITSAIAQPEAADHRELGRMVNEKVSAARGSQRALADADSRMRKAARANVDACSKVASGRWLQPDALLRLSEQNLAAAAIIALPAVTLAPFHKAVIADEKRLSC